MPSETTTACVSLLVFFRIRRGTFPYGVEDDASTISLTPTTHYTNTCVKLTIVTDLSFSERIAIANLSFKGKEQQLPRATMNRKISDSQIMDRVEIVKPRGAVYDPCHVRRCWDRLLRAGRLSDTSTVAEVFRPQRCIPYMMLQESVANVEESD